MPFYVGRRGCQNNFEISLTVHPFHDQCRETLDHLDQARDLCIHTSIHSSIHSTDELPQLAYIFAMV